MSRFFCLVFCALALLAHAPEAHAQLGGLRGRAERAARERAERAERAARERAEREARERAQRSAPTRGGAASGDAPTGENTDAPTRSTPPPEASGERGGVGGMLNRALGSDPGGTDYTPLDFSSVPLPPAISYASILDQLTLRYSDGLFDPTEFSAVFVPSQDIEGNPVDHLRQLRGRLVLRDGAGEVVLERYYNGLPSGGNPTVKRFSMGVDPLNDREIARAGRNRLYLTTSGDYTVEYFLDDRLLTRVPFRVVKIASGDVYAQQPPRYLMMGAWQTTGFVTFEDRDTGDDMFRWNWYEQLEDPDEEAYSYQAKIELRKDGQLLGRSTGVTISGGERRQIYTYSLNHARRSRTSSVYDEANVRRSDLTDGDYELRLTATEDTRGGGTTTRTARFSVRGGELVPAGNQVREGTASEDFIEGVNQAFYYDFSIPQ